MSNRFESGFFKIEIISVEYSIFVLENKYQLSAGSKLVTLVNTFADLASLVVIHDQILFHTKILYPIIKNQKGHSEYVLIIFRNFLSPI